jgi:hypothetical protein
VTFEDIQPGDVCAIVAVCPCDFMKQIAGRECEVISLFGMQPKWKGCCPLAPTNEEVFRVRVHGAPRTYYLSRSELRRRLAAEQVLAVPIANPPTPAEVAA